MSSAKSILGGMLVGMILWLGPTGSLLAEKEKPEAKIRAPRADEEVEHSFMAKGRTSNVPDGHMVILFRPVGTEGFLYPCTEAFKGNRSFSHKIYHEKTDKGKHALQVRIVPKSTAEKISKWRGEHMKWYEGGRKGPMPGFTIGWLESTVRLAEVEYVLEED